MRSLRGMAMSVIIISTRDPRRDIFPFPFRSRFARRLISSTVSYTWWKFDCKIVAGRATLTSPIRHCKAPIVMPAAVWGIISPYPTVVNVTRLNHIVSGML